MKALLLAIAAGLAWGIGEVCTKSVLHGGRIGPMTALAVRSTVALPAIWMVWWFTVQRGQTESVPSWERVPPSELARLLLGSGLTAGALAMACFYAALALDDVSRIKPIAFTIAPATAAVLGWLVLGETLTPRKWLAVALILVGVALLSSAPRR